MIKTAESIHMNTKNVLQKIKYKKYLTDTIMIKIQKMSY